MPASSIAARLRKGFGQVHAGSAKMPTGLAEVGGRYRDPPLWAGLPSFVSDRIMEGPFQRLHSDLLGLVQYACAYVLDSCPTHFSPI